jgi:hypothetical protein
MSALPEPLPDSAPTLPPALPAPLPEAFSGPPGAPPVPPACAAAVVAPGYEVLGELGRGGMGVVYKARQVKADRLVALKMILSGGHASATDLQRFRVEAEAVAKLQHPHIVQVFEVGEHDGRPFFSLEFCPGGSLAQKLAGTPLAAPEAAQLVEKLARAMQAAHEARVIHRDLKAGQRVAGGRRHAQGDRLRPGQAARRDGSDGQRRRAGDAELHGPGTGRRQARGGGAGGGRVGAGRHPLRVPDGATALQGGDAAGHDPPGGRRGAGAAVAPERAGADRPGDGLPQVLAEGAGEALRVGGGAGG